jgi:hypothetical protein
MASPTTIDQPLSRVGPLAAELLQAATLLSATRQPHDPVAGLLPHTPPLRASLRRLHAALQALPLTSHDDYDEQEETMTTTMTSSSSSSSSSPMAASLVPPTAKRPRPASSSNASFSPFCSGPSPGLNPSSRAMERVLNDPSLLDSILALVVTVSRGIEAPTYWYSYIPARQAKTILACLALVGRAWAAAAARSPAWRAIAERRLPLAAAANGAAVRAAPYCGDYRAFVLAHARALATRTFPKPNPLEGLELAVELYDATGPSAYTQRDYNPLLVARGPLRLGTSSHNQAVTMTVAGANRIEEVGSAFCPGDSGAGTIYRHFEEADRSDSELRLRARVFVCHAPTGRVSVLWETGKATRWLVFSSSSAIPYWAPPGTVKVSTDDRVSCRVLVDKPDLRADISFLVAPAPRSDALEDDGSGEMAGAGDGGDCYMDAEEEDGRSWRVVGGEAAEFALHPAAVTLKLDTGVSEEEMRAFLLSLF